MCIRDRCCIVGCGAGDYQWNERHDVQSGCHRNTRTDGDVPVSKCRLSGIWHRKCIYRCKNRRLLFASGSLGCGKWDYQWHKCHHILSIGSLHPGADCDLFVPDLCEVTKEQTDSLSVRQ